MSNVFTNYSYHKESLRHSPYKPFWSFINYIFKLSVTNL
jgi:hypothetical protein